MRASGCAAQLLSPTCRRACVGHIVHVMNVSERRACQALGQHRSTQRKVPRGRGDEEALTADLIELARQYGRYGYRKITALLRDTGWLVNPKRVERIWRREGLKVPQKQPKRRRLWLADGSCIRLRLSMPSEFSPEVPKLNSPVRPLKLSRNRSVFGWPSAGSWGGSEGRRSDDRF